MKLRRFWWDAATNRKMMLRQHIAMLLNMRQMW